MPAYIYKSPNAEEYIEVIQRMNDKHEFFDHEGVEWKRVFTVPNAVVSSGEEIDPFNIQKHVEKTGQMKGTVGDMWEFSKEMSARREEALGYEDPIKRKYFRDYAKKNNCRHYHDKGPMKIETKHATIDLSNPTDIPTGGAFDLKVTGDD